MKKYTISQAEDSWFDTKNQQHDLQSDVQQNPLTKLNTQIQDVLKRKSENKGLKKETERKNSTKPLKNQKTSEILRKPSVKGSALDPEVQNSIEEALRNADIQDPTFDKEKIEKAIDELRKS